MGNRTMNHSFLSALATGFMAVVVFAQAKLVRSQENETANQAPAGVNLAVVAKPSSSFASGDTSVTALNDGHEPRASRDRRRGSYGNWNRTGTQWVQYDWSQPISTNKIDVYWWADGQGIGLPEGCRLKYWD